ncbi:3-deoxy-D-manno-octulosonic acid transferase [Roseovarius atlanticus]|uniref:3-deoxy-D-manno-octulosonic acid transferase n=1 Tax=Roseovarius atlanticus TaxID=1641875 RepID=UPI001C95F19B|nr:3-deoxy-D-manno-octulosonic acid transferase [Roseovarius atlanticus]MBY5989231.1 3-deoxy-D-manno-octulosonic acid transferase [Roseovarius atlanticus]MBY6124623.1 3-deoxy-D-manno-octulosonic acid transferase [Roseovarius atlanticus]MBY6149118.1 3-deoxy-D-manno-octulosonic acid transferase [Roseovarius atlanticus]
MPHTAAPLPVRLYGVAANLLERLAYKRVSENLARQGIPANRLPERQGHATAPRPDGDLMWFHAASVGESLSVLRLIEHLGQTHPDLSFLITSGTATSAQIVGKRLPPRTTHQFAPLDSRRVVTRFLDHWRPSAAVFVESELWPQMLRLTHAAGVPLALVNARISDTSARNWKRFPRTARHLMDHFRLIHCQDDRTAHHLRDLGLAQAEPGLNLKSVAGPLPFDRDELHRMQSLIAGRPVWLAASTHPGEDEVVLKAHRAMTGGNADALLILVPRHPERAHDIERLIAEHRFEGARRSTGMTITGQTRVYLADTLGEMGLWYALSPLTCVCGSFSDVGGHNPFEPAHAGSAVLHGPRYANFAEAYAQMQAENACIEVADADDLSAKLTTYLDDPAALDALRDRTRAFAATQAGVLEDFAATLSNALGLG